jgi:hypothetical protein
LINELSEDLNIKLKVAALLQQQQLNYGIIGENEAQQQYQLLVKELEFLSKKSSPTFVHKVDNSLLKSILFPKKQTGTDFSKQMNYSTLITDVNREGVKTIILNRPNKGNAFDMRMWFEYEKVFNDLCSDSNTKVVILQGNNQTFSTGMDLSVFVEMQNTLKEEKCEARRREGLSNLIEYLQNAVNAPEKASVPVIACVDGHCIGGAVDVITACDLRYCTDNAVFSVKETDLAMVYYIYLKFLIKNLK